MHLLSNPVIISTMFDLTSSYYAHPLFSILFSLSYNLLYRLRQNLSIYHVGVISSSINSTNHLVGVISSSINSTQHFFCLSHLFLQKLYRRFPYWRYHESILTIGSRINFETIRWRQSTYHNKNATTYGLVILECMVKCHEIKHNKGIH